MVVPLRLGILLRLGLGARDRVRGSPLLYLPSGRPIASHGAASAPPVTGREGDKRRRGDTRNGTYEEGKRGGGGGGGV